MIVLRLFLLALLCDAAQLSAREKVRRTKRMREKREAAAGNAIPVQRGAGMAPAASEALPVSIAPAAPAASNAPAAPTASVAPDASDAPAVSASATSVAPAAPAAPAAPVAPAANVVPIATAAAAASPPPLAVARPASNATIRKCVDDATATGRYTGKMPTVEYRLHGDCRYARVGRSMARCALRHERVVFMGDSTMRQLFAAVACKLDGKKKGLADRRALRGRGRTAGGTTVHPKSKAEMLGTGGPPAKAVRPRHLPGLAMDGTTRLEWVVYRTSGGANECEPEVRNARLGRHRGGTGRRGPELEQRGLQGHGQGPGAPGAALRRRHEGVRAVPLRLARAHAPRRRRLAPGPLRGPPRPVPLTTEL